MIRPRDYWLTVIIDAMTLDDPSQASIYDWKTGKREFNQYKHVLQLQLYSCAMFARFAELEKLNAKLLYVDEPFVLSYVFSRSQAAVLSAKWQQRLNNMLNDAELIPNPNKQSCQFCPYQSGQNDWIIGTGDCNFNLRIPN